MGRYVSATSIDGEQGYALQIDDQYRFEVDVLKQLTWRYVIARPSLASQQEGQVTVIRDLFKILIDAMEGRRQRALLPQRAQESLLAQDTPRLRGRVACDLICSMTEQEAVRLHRRLTGVDIGSVIDPLLPI